jgi:hypothetical protein
MSREVFEWIKRAGCSVEQQENSATPAKWGMSVMTMTLHLARFTHSAGDFNAIEKSSRQIVPK